MRRDEMIEMITETVKNTHNEQDLIDLNAMSFAEVNEIFEELFNTKNQ